MLQVIDKLHNQSGEDMKHQEILQTSPILSPLSSLGTTHVDLTSSPDTTCATELASITKRLAQIYSTNAISFFLPHWSSV